MNRINRDKLKKAIRFMFYQRTSTRKELELYSRFNSALMGLLRLVFYDIAKLLKTSSGLLRISLKGTRYFPSSAERSPRDLEIAKEQGFSVVLMSYFALRDDPNENWKFHCRRLGLKVLVDSGAFSAWRAAEEGKEVEPIEVEDYARFLLKHQNDEILFGCFTLDVVGDIEATRRNTEYLKSMGLKPIEIWHVQSPWEVLDQMIAEQDHPVIGIGGSVKLSEGEREEIFKELFTCHPLQNFHFLGGSSKLLYQFPWLSRYLHGLSVQDVKNLSHSLIFLLLLSDCRMYKLSRCTKIQ